MKRKVYGLPTIGELICDLTIDREYESSHQVTVEQVKGLKQRHR